MNCRIWQDNGRIICRMQDGLQDRQDNGRIICRMQDGLQDRAGWITGYGRIPAGHGRIDKMDCRTW
jgi:hypothetical protein